MAINSTPDQLASARRKLQNIVAPPARASSITGLNPSPQQEVVGSVVIANDPSIREMPPTGPTLASPPTPSFFIPKETVTSIRPLEMIALVGAPGSGKTTSCLTFPNRLWLDFDNKLPQGESSIPFWNSPFCDTIYKPTAGFGNANRRNAFRKWLEDNHKKFVPEQTLILDSWTLMFAAHDVQTYKELDQLPLNKDGQPNGFWFWGHTLRYAREIIEMLKGINCRKVITFHETRERNEKDQLTGKIRPVMNGSFKDQLLGYCTDVYRQMKDPPKRGADGKRITVGTAFAIEEGWFWQLVGDDVMDCNTNPVLGAKVRAKGLRLIPASFAELEKIYNS